MKTPSGSAGRRAPTPAPPTAYLLSIGSGEQSRIYNTTDAGLTWVLQFTNPEPAGF